MKHGSVFPSGAISYECIAPRHVRVRFKRRRWLFWTQIESETFRLSADGMRWYWKASGIRLEYATSGQWSALYEAIGEHPGQNTITV